MYSLTSNPFEQQATHDFEDFEAQPFILEGLDMVRALKTKLTWNLVSPQRIFVKVLALKGFGKSSVSFFLQSIIKEANNPKILYFYNNQIDLPYFKLINNLMSEFRLSKQFDDGEQNIEEKKAEAIRNFLSDKKLYLFFDFQDITNISSLRVLADTLERIPPLSRNISVFVSLNKAHALKMENVSFVLGKYTQFELAPFSLYLTKKLIIARLNKFREKDYSGDSLYPFTEESVRLIYTCSGGIPRNIISACDLIFSSFQGKEITESEIPNLLKNEFSKKVIYDMTDDENERMLLIQLYNTIKEDFNGEVNQENELHAKTLAKFGWCVRTSRKRIRQLNKFGLITISKGKDLWKNTIKLI